MGLLPLTSIMCAMMSGRQGRRGFRSAGSGRAIIPIARAVLSVTAEDFDARDTLDCLQIPAGRVGIDYRTTSQSWEWTQTGAGRGSWLISCGDSVNLVGLPQAE